MQSFQAIKPVCTVDIFNGALLDVQITIQRLHRSAPVANIQYIGLAGIHIGCLLRLDNSSRNLR